MYHEPLHEPLRLTIICFGRGGLNSGYIPEKNLILRQKIWNHHRAYFSECSFASRWKSLLPAKFHILLIHDFSWQANIWTCVVILLKPKGKETKYPIISTYKYIFQCKKINGEFSAHVNWKIAIFNSNFINFNSWLLPFNCKLPLSFLFLQILARRIILLPLFQFVNFQRLLLTRDHSTSIRFESFIVKTTVHGLNHSTNNKDWTVIWIFEQSRLCGWGGEVKCRCHLRHRHLCSRQNELYKHKMSKNNVLKTVQLHSNWKKKLLVGT